MPPALEPDSLGKPTPLAGGRKSGLQSYRTNRREHSTAKSQPRVEDRR